MNPYEFKVSLTPMAREMLRPGEALVLDWHRLAVCCAGAGESSLYVMKEEGARKRKGLVRLKGEDPVYAARAIFPHLAGHKVRLDARRVLLSPLYLGPSGRLRAALRDGAAAGAGPQRRLGEDRNPPSGAVLRFGRAGHTGAVGAAVERAVHLDTVADDLYAAVLAGWGERVNRALEAVERTWLLTGHGDLEGFVVLVTAQVALGHDPGLLSLVLVGYIIAWRTGI